MKKYLAVLLGVLFIFSFTATAFAVHETVPPEESVVSKGPAKITLGGKIVARGWYFDNIGPQVIDTSAADWFGVNTGALPVSSHSQALYTTNVYLTVDAKIGENVQGFMELESSSRESNNSGVLYWGTYDTKNDMELKFRQLWLQYTGSGLLGVPTGIKAGHMPISLGEKIFLNNERFGSDAIVVWVDPMKDLHLLAGTVKLVESSNVNVGSINHAEDLDGYLLLATYMLDKDNTVGINYVLANSDSNLPSTAAIAGIPNCSSLNFQNVGVHANGKILGFSYGAEVDFNFGKAQDVDVLAGADAKFKGWGVFARAAYMLDPVNIRASFARGSGDKDINDNSIKEFQTLVGTDATGAIARYPHYTQIYERSVRTAALSAIVSTNPGGNIRTTGIANTTYYNLGIDVNPVKEVAVSLDGYILRATENAGWNQLAKRSVSKNVGWELDSKISWKIAKNLTYFVEAAYFDVGGFYQDAFDIKEKNVTQAVHGLLLTF